MTQKAEHVAIIMDGNRRWATKQGIVKTSGHEAGAQALENMVKSCIKFGVNYLTVYALSTENFTSRTKLEISFLLSLFNRLIKEKIPVLEENGVSIKFIGEIDGLPNSLQDEIAKAEERLSKNSRLRLTVAINYGSRAEIVSAIKAANKNDLTQQDISDNTYTQGMPDPDLIIRTGGEQRLSNFLLWQGAYSELFFTDTLWPDFEEAEFKKILENFEERKRNFGR